MDWVAVSSDCWDELRVRQTEEPGDPSMRGKQLEVDRSGKQLNLRSLARARVTYRLLCIGGRSRLRLTRQHMRRHGRCRLRPEAERFTRQPHVG